MKFQNLHIVLLLFFLIIVSNANAQKILSEYDSIPVNKLKSLKTKYDFHNSGLGEITISSKYPKTVDKSPSGFLGGTFTLLTGISTESFRDAKYVTQNEIAPENTSLVWETPFYFDGTFSKTRDRVKNDDGSYSINVDKTISVNFDNGIFGYIIEQNDTIGRFSFNRYYNDRQSDEFVDYWLSKIEKDENLESRKIINSMFIEANNDFIVDGEINENKFTIIGKGSHFRSVILINNEPKVVFQNKPNLVLLNKKNRTNTYVLIDKNLNDTERINLLKLVMLSGLISNFVDVTLYSN
jgi:hypothetical protein